MEKKILYATYLYAHDRSKSVDSIMVQYDDDTVEVLFNYDKECDALTNWIRPSNMVDKTRTQAINDLKTLCAYDVIKGHIHEEESE